jgi:hypothetical protein
MNDQLTHLVEAVNRVGNNLDSIGLILLFGLFLFSFKIVFDSWR